MYYRGAAAAIVVYDLTSKVRYGALLYFRSFQVISSVFTLCFFVFVLQQSFVRAKQWVKELQKQVGLCALFSLSALYALNLLREIITW